MNIYKRMRQALKEVAQPVAKVVGRSRKERRAIARRELLPSDCVCPKCGNTVLESNRWIIREGVSICKSCFQKS